MTSIVALFCATPFVHHPNISPLSTNFHANLTSITATRKSLCKSTMIGAFSNSTTSVKTPSSTASAANATASVYTDEENEAMAKVGCRVRVNVPLKVYHIPRVAEFDLNGLEGEFKQFVAVWKGKQISANLPFKVQFVESIQGRDGPVKFFAHLKEDEFEYLD